MAGTVSVDVDIDDILDELSDDDLRDELESRGRNFSKGLFDLERAKALFRDGDIEECIYELERILFPKWSSPAEAMKAMSAVKKTHTQA